MRLEAFHIQALSRIFGILSCLSICSSVKTRLSSKVGNVRCPEKERIGARDLSAHDSRPSATAKLYPNLAHSSATSTDSILQRSYEQAIALSRYQSLISS